MGGSKNAIGGDVSPTSPKTQKDDKSSIPKSETLHPTIVFLHKLSTGKTINNEAHQSALPSTFFLLWEGSRGGWSLAPLIHCDLQTAASRGLKKQSQYPHIAPHAMLFVWNMPQSPILMFKPARGPTSSWLYSFHHSAIHRSFPDPCNVAQCKGSALEQ